MTPSRERGVTLLELLVAMTLFALLSTAVLFSLRTGIGSLERTRARLDSARRAGGASRALDRMLDGIIAAQAEFTPPLTAQPSVVRFFQGESAAMRFVTTYSLQEGFRGRPHVVELAAMPREDRDGLRLIANETVYFGPPSAGMSIVGMGVDPADGYVGLLFRPVVAGPQSFVIADKIPVCRFAYLDATYVPGTDRWVPRWKSDAYPRAIRIDMGPNRVVTSRLYVSYLQ